MYNNKETLLTLMKEYPEIIRQRDRQSATGFIVACFQNNKETVEIFIEKYPEII